MFASERKFKIREKLVNAMSSLKSLVGTTYEEICLYEQFLHKGQHFQNSHRRATPDRCPTLAESEGDCPVTEMDDIPYLIYNLEMGKSKFVQEIP